MALRNDASSSVDPLPRWIQRIGAAVVAPRLAMSASDRPEGSGRSSSDIVLLLFVAIVAIETKLFATAGWMLADGDWSGAFTVLVVGARDRLVGPIVLLLAGTVALTIVAGRRRSASDDFDLVCVALIPLVVVELVNSLLFRAGVDARALGVVVGYAWALGLWGLAYLQTQKREIA